MRKLILAVFLFLIFGSPVLSEDFFLLGKKAFKVKDYQKADTYFVKALTQDPNDAEARYYYAQTLTYLKNYEQAKIEYGYVIQLAPSTILAQYAQTSLEYLNKHNNAHNLSSKQNFPNQNYLKKALTSEGNLMTWNVDKMPLKVYVDNSYNASAEIVNSAKKALATWENASEGLVKFLYVDNPTYADITITFEGMAKQTENQILGYTQHNSDNDHIKNVKIVLYTLGPNYQKLSPIDIYNVALHEYGHMLGIWGHSDNSSDVMYALYDTKSKDVESNLSDSDKNTLVLLYKIDKNPYSKEYNSINSLLGSKSSRINEKLEQELAYVKKIPNNPIGYVNVGNSYLAMEKEYEAISYYKQALKIDSNNKEANIALANIYTKRNDLYNAEIYYKNLIKIAPKETNAYLNLANLYIRNNKFSKAKSTMQTLFYRNSSAKQDDRAKNIVNYINNK